MEITGKLIQILPAQIGTGKNGPWKKCDFIIETEDKFPRQICITAWKGESDLIEKVASNTKITVSFDLSSREYNGKWYTDVKAWKIIVITDTDQPSRIKSGGTNSNNTNINASEEDSEEEVPF